MHNFIEVIFFSEIKIGKIYVAIGYTSSISPRWYASGYAE